MVTVDAAFTETKDLKGNDNTPKGSWAFWGKDNDIAAVATILPKGAAYDDTTSAVGWDNGNRYDGFGTVVLEPTFSAHMKVQNGNPWHLVLINTSDEDDAQVSLIYGGATQLLTSMVASALSLLFLF